MRHLEHKIEASVLKNLSSKGMIRWLTDASLDWLIIAVSLAITLYHPGIITITICLILLGNRQHALALLGHDGTHFTLSRSKILNDFITNFFTFWPLGLTISGYRSLHYKHHKHTGSQEDPELAHKRSRSPQWDLPAKPLKILKYAALDFIGNSIPDYIIIITYSKPDKKRSYVPLILMHSAFLISAIYFGYWLLPLLWYASLTTTFMMFFRLRLWLEHQGTSETHRLYLNPIEAAILAPHYGWMHWEHHNWPGIPYHRLPQLRKHIADVPILTLKDLLMVFKSSEPILSGQVMRKN